MNQDQRKYLISQVDSTLRHQVEELERQKPRKPSLNNYLVAAFLDNTVQFKNLDNLKPTIRERVLKMGKEDVLIEEDDDNDTFYYGRKRKNKTNFIRLIAEEIFEIPQGYTDALKEYEEKNIEIEEKIKTLQAQAKTVTMKIQIGSAAALNKLVTEVDNLADLSIMNSQFLLGDSK